MKKSALICGVSGQDGAYLSHLLLEKGYDVWGTSRDASGSSFNNLHTLRIHDQVRFITMMPEDFRSVMIAIQTSRPDEIYFLAGQSSVGLSFELPTETIKSFSVGILNILDACRLINPEIKIYNAGSSECFGNTETAADETTPFQPRSPYAVAKASSYWIVNNYREAYNLFACNGILFNHESPLRPRRFVTQKIISTALAIKHNKSQKLYLGRLDIARDWGWAPEYVEAMWRILQQPSPDDFIIATGHTSTLEEFVAETFSRLGMNWREFVIQNRRFIRPSDILISRANPEKAQKILGWKASFRMTDVVEQMLQAEEASLSNHE